MPPTAPPETGAPRSASVPLGGPDPVAALAARLGPGPFALVLIFAGEGADLPVLLARAPGHFGRCAIAGCTTAGELGEGGYADRSLVAIGFPEAGFAASTVLIDPIDAIDTRPMIARLQEARQDLARRAPQMPQELGILLVDGMSGREEHLVASLAGGLGPVRIIGGSAGDGRAFDRTRVFCGQQMRDRAAAVLCLLRSRMAMRPFSFNSARPSRTQMVVTRADPAARTVLRINDEPAAREYARLLGCDPADLGPQMFATRPVMVRAGSRHFVRAIRGVGPDDGLQFFGAVAEGMVLTLAGESDMATHLAQSFADLSAAGAPRMILGFDCIFRRMDAEARQQMRPVSDLLVRHRVAGFSTYGEQTGGMHVNQTLTGVAFFDPA
ncbi:GfdT protein [Paracoccus aestuarii]|uniref:GfdT protein n=1 Tax=Paracoccus aestuarii TaxID=453842 RepID=A0A418ZW09_9RHOB|nr:FIST N-terminal domain-containing protein [Paracoccus aestuarii]RJL04033.1 GfdT protein [Paracoccus aestuarii]WCR01045.1 FIST C-terminal domain-containing protein [Paracoccus aestuarii]